MFAPEFRAARYSSKLAVLLGEFLPEPQLDNDATRRDIDQLSAQVSHESLQSEAGANPLQGLRVGDARMVRRLRHGSRARDVGIRLQPPSRSASRITAIAILQRSFLANGSLCRLA